MYGQAQSLLTEARNAEKKKNIDSLVAEASAFRKAGENDKSLATIEKLLALDPANATGKSIGDEIRDEKYAKATKDEQDQIVNDALAKAEELFKAGNLEGASQKVDEVTKNRPDDPASTNLKRRITSQINAANKARAERTKAEQAKASARSAKAPELAADSFTRAQTMEERALSQQGDRQFDQAAKSFSDTTGLYAAAEREAHTAANANALAAQRTQQLKNQADNAHREYDQNQTKAHDAGGHEMGGPYQSGMRVANEAQTKFDRSDFNGARTDWENASKQMQQAFTMADAVKPVPAPPPAAPPQPPPAQNTATQTAAAQPSAAQKAAAQREDDRAIRAVIERYRTAYGAKDLAGIEGVFPNLSRNGAKRYRREHPRCEDNSSCDSM